jgi:hypothetical protein
LKIGKYDGVQIKVKLKMSDVKLTFDVIGIGLLGKPMTLPLLKAGSRGRVSIVSFPAALGM